MKKIFLYTCAFSLLAISALGAHEDKYYVEAGSIYIAPNGIFLNIEGELCGVSSVAVDEEGVYVSTPTAGFCGKHGYYPGNSPICPYCATDKKKKK